MTISDPRRVELASQIEALHYGECARDAYGDEGDGYDFEKLVSLMIKAGWTPPPATEGRCICSGQGGSAYSSGCPQHDSSVDTSDVHWRAMYDGHIESQRRIKERLGW